MPIADPNKIWPKLENDGPDEVRKKLAMGVYAGYKIPVIKEWLRRKENEQSDSILIQPEKRANDKKDDLTPQKMKSANRELENTSKKKEEQNITKSRVLGALITKFFFRAWKDPVLSKIIAVGLLSLIGILVGLYKTGNESNNQKKPPETTVQKKLSAATNSSLASSGSLPYLENLPILDKTIYLKYSYNDLLIGGKNIGKLKVAARTHDGRDAKPFYESYPKAVTLDIHEKPYVEFEYADKYYSVEITGEMHSYKYTLSVIPDQTQLSMDLIPVIIK